MQKKVLITGGNRGVGLALVCKFLAEGFQVIATSRNGEIEKVNHPDLTVVKLEITSSASISNAVSTIKKDFGSIDFLINNAGVGLDFDEYHPEIDVVRATFETNVFGLLNFTESFLDLINDGGTIFNVSSVMGMLNREKIVPNATAYRMSKSALNMYTKTLSARLHDRNINVLSIHPGWVKTDMGGEDADVTPEFSANGIFELYQKRLPSGTFWAADNQVELNW
ncbi:SDR family NAD(P)-dependent oxidoreductase [Flavobacterium amniphilum]|uniref:SDR family NAD(P)-dependent oxidoreductase n=1 Tax=Flavobacterium amniphilum TaxID=1834035 RepID=UPI002029DF4C|nr:SDR family NAD(P)-dependent oxidoreductase [Flavobacterium amniphilum]MCL9805371.1 SDR family NAD(P)-dependent oxidoreductase [Flavobacterium amniphilum]